MGNSKGSGNTITALTSADMVSKVFMFALSKGLPLQTVSEATGLKIDDMLQPEGPIPHVHLARLWLLILEAYPNQAIALEMAALAPEKYFGSLTYAARFAPDLRGAINVAARYHMLLSTGLSMQLVDQPTYSDLVVSHVMDEQERGCGIEAGFGVTWQWIRRLSNTSKLKAVHFRHAPNGPTHLYENFFAAPVYFNQHHSALSLSRAVLESCQQDANSEGFSVITAHLDQAQRTLLAREQDARLCQLRREIAGVAQGCEYQASAIAKRLGVGLRTLQRRAKGHGVTLRQLIDETRQAHAEHLLTDEKMSIDDIAFLMGYSQESAFRRAYARWTGHSPSQQRRQMRAHVRSGV